MGVVEVGRDQTPLDVTPLLSHIQMNLVAAFVTPPVSDSLRLVMSLPSHSGSNKCLSIQLHARQFVPYSSPHSIALFSFYSLCLHDRIKTLSSIAQARARQSSPSRQTHLSVMLGDV